MREKLGRLRGFTEAMTGLVWGTYTVTHPEFRELWLTFHPGSDRLRGYAASITIRSKGVYLGRLPS